MVYTVKSEKGREGVPVPVYAVAMDENTIGNRVRARRNELGLNQEDVARLAGTSQATIDKIENGRSRRSKFLPSVFAALGLPLDELPHLTARAPGRAIPRDELVGDRDLPVFASVEGGSGQIIVTTDVIDRVRRPEPLLHVPQGYGVLVTGESMIPRFRPGDIALVHPLLPPRVEDPVVLFTEGRDKATIKEYRGASEKVWKLLRYQPKQEEFTLPKKDWPAIETVVGTYYRR